MHDNNIFYFGCIDRAGHFLWSQYGMSVTEYSRYVPDDFPVHLNALDQGFLPLKANQVEGQAYLAYINGWTIVAFWDRSVDKRPNSNSAFLIRGQMSFDQVMAFARLAFPKVFQRFEFNIQLANNE